MGADGTTAALNNTPENTLYKEVAYHVGWLEQRAKCEVYIRLIRDLGFKLDDKLICSEDPEKFRAEYARKLTHIIETVREDGVTIGKRIAGTETKKKALEMIDLVWQV